MANGRAHAKANYKALQTLADLSILLALGGHVEGFYILLGGFGAFLAGPDLDVDGRTEDESRWYRVWPPLGVLFTAYWLPYSLIPHRSKWSHLPGLASALRMVYALAIPAYLWLRYIGPLPWPTLFLMWVGWSIVDTVHLAKDGWRLFS